MVGWAAAEGWGWEEAAAGSAAEAERGSAAGAVRGSEAAADLGWEAEAAIDLAVAMAGSEVDLVERWSSSCLNSRSCTCKSRTLVAALVGEEEVRLAARAAAAWEEGCLHSLAYTTTPEKPRSETKERRPA